MVQGSCLCRAVKFEISAPIDAMTNCHCSMCRKAHGAAFVTWARTAASAVRYVSGEEKVRCYRSSRWVQRTFCSDCGSNLLFLFDGTPDVVWVAAGTLDEDPGVRPGTHIFVGSKAPWHTIGDDLPQYEEDVSEAEPPSGT